MKDFSYKEFVDQVLMTLATFEQFYEDKNDLVEKLQWAGSVLLKLAVVCHYLESVVSSRVRAWAKAKDLEEKMVLL